MYGQMQENSSQVSIISPMSQLQGTKVMLQYYPNIKLKEVELDNVVNQTEIN